MKLGICSLWGTDLSAFRTEIRLASNLGYELVTVGDSPAGWHDLYVSLTLASMDAPEAQLAPLVTSPFLRHPIASANALATLDELTGGRVALGLATGGSTVMAIGRAPANQDEIRQEFAALRALLNGTSTNWDDRPVKPLRFPRPVPIYYSAFGPKALQLAGEQADGVILFAGQADMDGLAVRIDAVRTAAIAAGRDPDAVDIWAVSYVSVRSKREEALADLEAFIAVNAMAFRTPEAMARVPEEFRGRILEFQSRYDPTEHVVVGGRNVALMKELGLRDFLARFDTFAGSEAEATAWLSELETLGVSTLIAALPGHADPLSAIKGLAAARNAL
jgi:alkanesulfonate monooxygenase SsuD/methylene tetrahydromethanopterin reductase-like flavin-dependent oxidoreductase (luciferase family)